MSTLCFLTASLTDPGFEPLLRDTPALLTNHNKASFTTNKVIISNVLFILVILDQLCGFDLINEIITDSYLYFYDVICAFSTCQKKAELMTRVILRGPQIVILLVDSGPVDLVTS